MSLIDELEIISDNMSPRFMADIKNKLKDVVEDPSSAKVTELKSEINEFVWAVKIMGVEELEETLGDLIDTLEGHGSWEERLDRFSSGFEKLERIIPVKEPETHIEETEAEGEPDKPIDEANIERFLMIPGIGRVKALALINGGFERVEDLANAPLARITMVPGISLSLAKDIADFLNPNRFSGVEILPKTLGQPRPSTEISFLGKKSIDGRPEADEFAEIYEDDPELMELFIARLKVFIGEVTMILDDCATSSPPGRVISELEETSVSLLNVTRYMGFDLIESELSNIAEVTGEIISGDIDFTESVLFAIKQAKTGLEYGLDKLREFKKIPDLPEITKEEIQAGDDKSAHEDMDEIQRLYKNMGGILKKVSEAGKLDKEDVKRLKGSTELLNRMAESLTKSSDEREG